MKNIFTKKYSLLLAIIIPCIMLAAILGVSAQNATIVPHGGTGLDYIPEGYVLIGDSIDSLLATSSIFINNDGSVTIGTLEITNEIVPGPLTADEIHITGTASTTLQIDGTTATQGACLKLKDYDSTSFTYCIVKDGTMTCSATACN